MQSKNGDMDRDEALRLLALQEVRVALRLSAKDFAIIERNLAPFLKGALTADEMAERLKRHYQALDAAASADKRP